MDKRILKNPLSGFDSDEVKRCLYTSKKGYFGNFVEDFEDVSKLTFGTLRCTVDGFFSPDENGKDLFTFFIPEDWVGPEPSEEYRPYTLEEFRLSELFEEYELLDSENKFVPFGTFKIE